MKTMQVQIADGLQVAVIPNMSYEFLMSTEDVARGYGIGPGSLRSHKQRNLDELIEGEHFLTGRTKGVAKSDTLAPNAQPHQVYWTKAGIIRLGFFIKSNNAKMFRNWAEKLILKELEQPRPSLPTRYIPESNRELSLTFQNLALRELLKVENSRVRNRLGALIDFYASQIV